MAKHSDFQLNIFHARLTRDPEMRYTPAGKAVTTLSVATNRAWTDGGEQVHEEVQFWRLSAWGKQAEVVNQYLKKGVKYQFTYRVDSDKSGENRGGPRLWERADGTKAASFEGTLLSFEFLGGGGNSAGSSEDVTGESNTPFEGSEIPPEDDIPF